MSVKAVIWDLSGVCFTEGAKQVIEMVCKEYGLSKKDAAAVFSGETVEKCSRGEMTASEFWKEANKSWGTDIAEEKLQETWLTGHVPINETIEIIEILKEAGCNSYFLSNNIKEGTDYLEKEYDFRKWFTAGIFSSEVGITKPNKEIYAQVLELTGCEPGECIYIDDKKEFLEEPKKMGMETIHFTSPEKTQDALIESGVFDALVKNADDLCL